jgi:hypothetical protein
MFHTYHHSIIYIALSHRLRNNSNTVAQFLYMSKYTKIGWFVRPVGDMNLNSFTKYVNTTIFSSAFAFEAVILHMFWGTFNGKAGRY